MFCVESFMVKAVSQPHLFCLCIWLPHGLFWCLHAFFFVIFPISNAPYGMYLHCFWHCHWFLLQIIELYFWSIRKVSRWYPNDLCMQFFWDAEFFPHTVLVKGGGGIADKFQSSACWSKNSASKPPEISITFSWTFLGFPFPNPRDFHEIFMNIVRFSLPNTFGISIRFW